MPRQFVVEVRDTKVLVTEKEEKPNGDYHISTYHNTDIDRFIDQNNVSTTIVENKPRKKFKKINVIIDDSDMFETYKLTIYRHTDGTITNIIYNHTL